MYARISHVTDVNKSYRRYEWVMSHIPMSSVTHAHESCHIYECVRAHMWMLHVNLMDESCCKYKWVMSHIRLSHGTHIHESCRTTPCPYAQHDIMECTTWLIRMCRMTFSCMCHDSFPRMTRRIHICHGRLIPTTYTCVQTNSYNTYVCTFIRVTAETNS